MDSTDEQFGGCDSDETLDLERLGLSAEDDISLHWTWSEDVDGGGLVSLDLSLEVDTSESS